MRPTVVDGFGRGFHVKNLGWLLSHWKEVGSFAFVFRRTGPPLLHANLRDGRTYITDYADLTVFLDRFGNRPVFEGVPLTIYRQLGNGGWDPLTGALKLARTPARFWRAHPDLLDAVGRRVYGWM